MFQFLLLETLCAAYFFSGCTAFGFLVGSNIDGSTPAKDTLNITQFYAVKEGDDVVVTLRNGEVVSGSFRGLDSLTAAEYAKNYNACRSGNVGGADLPVLSDSVTLYLRGNTGQSSPTIGGEFVGFDKNLIVLKNQGVRTVLTTHIFQTLTDCHGHVMHQDDFAHLMSEGGIALMTGLVVKTGNGPEHLQIESIQLMELYHSRNAKFILGGIGLACDIAAIATIRAHGFGWK